MLSLKANENATGTFTQIFRLNKLLKTYFESILPDNVRASHFRLQIAKVSRIICYGRVLHWQPPQSRGRHHHRVSLQWGRLHLSQK